jgi:hypothetical protein
MDMHIWVAEASGGQVLRAEVSSDVLWWATMVAVGLAHE